MRLLAAWAWESFENLPLLFGFVTAARLWQASFPIAVAVLVLGIGLGVLFTRLVEPKLHKAKHEVRWVSVMINFILFVVLAIPFLYYFQAETSWASWKTDFLGGVIAALLLTFVQSLHWRGPKSRMVLHGAAMLAAFPVIMLGLRYIIRVDHWSLVMLFSFLLTLFASLMIALIDYQEMYRNTGER